MRENIRPRIKVCGMTAPANVAEAVSLGVDAIGVILHANSPRLIDLEQAGKIRSEVPVFVTLVGVFVDAPIELVNEYIDAVGLDMVQLHGNETRSYAEKLNRPYIKAIRAKNSDQVQTEMDQFSDARAILLDPYVKGQHGGTGRQLDIDLWAQVHSPVPLILAGGLSPDNVKDTVDRCQPHAIDLNSGIEDAPGVKNIKKLQQVLCLLGRS